MVCLELIGKVIAKVWIGQSFELIILKKEGKINGRAKIFNKQNKMREKRTMWESCWISVVAKLKEVIGGD